jgi:hypothetical protein
VDFSLVYQQQWSPQVQDQGRRADQYLRSMADMAAQLDDVVTRGLVRLLMEWLLF